MGESFYTAVEQRVTLNYFRRVDDSYIIVFYCTRESCRQCRRGRVYLFVLVCLVYKELAWNANLFINHSVVELRTDDERRMPLSKVNIYIRLDELDERVLKYKIFFFRLEKL